MTLLSRLAGLAREILMAAALGAGLHKSAFDLAFKLPNLFRRLFGEGALSTAFVPVFTRTFEEDGPAAANRLAAAITGWLLTVLGSILFAGILLTFGLQSWLPEGPPGGRIETLRMTLPLIRILLPYALAICLAALAMGALNARGSFGIPALAPVVLNLVWIGVILWVFPRLGADRSRQVRALAWGILLAGVLQVGIQIPFLVRHGIRPRVDFRFRRNPELRRVLRLMAPVAIGMGVVQCNVLIDGALALFAAPWAPAALEYAHRLVYLPLGLFATALGTVLLPTFSRQAAHGRTDLVRTDLDRALRNVLWVMTPMAALLLVLRQPATALLFERGAFGPLETLRTSRALLFYAPGLLLFSLHKALTPAFYALRDSRTPMRVALWSVGLNLVLNVIFVTTWPPEFKHAGLAAATLASSLFTVVCLHRILRRRLPPSPPSGGNLAAAVCRCVASGTLAALAAEKVYDTLAAQWPSPGLIGEFFTLGAAGAAGAVLYAAILALVDPRALAKTRKS